MRRTTLILLLFSLSLFASEPITIKAEADATNSPYDNLKLGVPTFQDVVIVDREGFAVGFSTKYKVPLWVCYTVTADEVQNPVTKRSNRFKPDPVITITSKPSDYTKTGYDRGHLAPAADLCFSVKTMEDSFYMSNMAPQLPGLNRKSWKFLEDAVRVNAIKEEKLAIVAGVIFNEGEEIKYIGDGVAVPHGFYKVILDLTPPMKAIGFIFKHEEAKQHFTAFACTVKEVEARTGLNFFNRLPADQEEALEKTFTVEAWEFNK